MLEAAATLVMIYFVFDVQYPRELANTCNFLDACVGRIDKNLKIRPCVQRKMNILLAWLYLTGALDVLLLDSPSVECWLFVCIS